MNKVIEMKNVTWIRENRTILKQIDWEVQEGEHWAVLGLNGSGKTALLNIVNGYIWPSKGEVSVLGRRFGQTDIGELRKAIGWVSSSLQSRLHGTDSAESVVLSGKYASIGLYEKPAEEDIRRALDLMKELGCSHLLGRMFQTCSQGEQQRLLIARALMASPRLLILDEPCNGLDLFAREQLLQRIDQLARKPDSPTLIYVTHHVEEILPVFEKTLLIRSGEIYLAGKTREVLTAETLSGFFQAPVEVEWREERAWLKVKSWTRESMA